MKTNAFYGLVIYSIIIQRDKINNKDQGDRMLQRSTTSSRRYFDFSSQVKSIKSYYRFRTDREGKNL